MLSRVPLIEAVDLRKTYGAGATQVEAVRGVDLSIEPGEFIAVMGPSGCGKSTLLHLCGAMDRATSGRLEVLDVVLGDLDDDALTRLRRDRLGFVFQFFNLLPTLTVEENVALPLLLGGVARSAAMTRARALIREVGMEHRREARPQQLSGGEMQRAAIARAVVHEPPLVIADEPTGNLDSENGARVLSLLRRLNGQQGVAILLATHDADVASTADRTLLMRDGRIVEEHRPSPSHLPRARAAV